MLPAIETIVDFFERMGLDEKNYFSLENRENNMVCIYYQKNNTHKNWSIWYFKQEETTKKIVSATDLSKELELFKVDPEEFIKQISSSVLLQAAFADEFIRQVTDILGPDAVQKSILQTQNFMTNLSEIVEKLMNQEQTTPSKEKKDKKESKPRLRIVK